MTQLNRRLFFERISDKIFNEKFVTAIELAYRMAKYAHRNQIRDDGRRYFEHVRGVAWTIMTELTIENEKELTILVIAALLHDMIEDTFLAEEKHLKFIFDQIDAEITLIVGELTKPKDKKNRWQRLLASRRRLTGLVKAADRLCNQSDMSACSTEKIEKKNKETAEIILPWLRKFKDVDDNINYLILKIEQTIQYNELAIKARNKLVKTAQQA